MDFFEAQAAARRTTAWLIALFAAAVVTLVLITVSLIATFVAWTLPPMGLLSWDKILHALSPQMALGIAAAVTVGIAAASIGRFVSLADGGRAVAEALHGHPVPPNTSATNERRLLNVVEEMAIAAGLPVPPVYVIDEPGINAFAAGYTADDAVIGVTRGTLELLDRQELQGVVGHEFSHVLNGDMRLNLRLVALLFGIVAIGVIGRGLVGMRAGQSGRRRRGFGTSQTALLAVGLILIGYAGTLFGNLIKAAVSRQREFLADASAVQFTRNPAGIAGALRKIGALTDGSRLASGRAGEMSHMFFGPVASNWLGLTASHPPLESRIRAVDPAWDGSWPLVVPHVETEHRPSTPAVSADRTTGAFALHISGAPVALATAGNTPEPAVGRITPAQVDRARELIDGLPRAFHDAAHDPFGARAAIHALLMPADTARQEQAIVSMEANTEAGVVELLRKLLAVRPALPAGGRLTVVQLAMPALKMLSRPQYLRFRANVTALIRLDGAVSPFEWILHHILLKELRPHFENSARRRRAGSARIEDEASACLTLLATLAHIDHGQSAAAEAAYHTGAATLGLNEAAHQALALAAADRNCKRLTAALRRLRQLHPLVQPLLLKAAIATVEHNHVVSHEEHELLHGVAAALDCPLPPVTAAAA